MNILKKIVQDKPGIRTWLPYIALFAGFFLLLLSVQLYLNLQSVLSNSGRKDGVDFLVVNKQITNDMMGDNARSFFSRSELDALQQAPTVEGMARIVSNTFPIAASTTGDLGFYTQLFFESLPDDYLDVQPEPWQWSPGQQTVPVVLSADFLNLYNFGFALSQGLPQLSEESIKALSFELTIGNFPHSETYTAVVAGFSRRYASVLVPKSFMLYANQHFGQTESTQTSRVVLKTKEADHPKFTSFLQEHGYVTRQENISLSKLKPLLHRVFGALGILGLFVLSLAFIALSLFLELAITRHQEKLKLLAVLGYPPSALQSVFTLGIFRMVALLTALSAGVLSGLQYLAARSLKPLSYELSLILHPLVWLLAIMLPGFVYLLLSHRVRRLISPLY